MLSQRQSAISRDFNPVHSYVIYMDPFAFTEAFTSPFERTRILGRIRVYSWLRLLSTIAKECWIINKAAGRDCHWSCLIVSVWSKHLVNTMSGSEKVYGLPSTSTELRFAARFAIPIDQTEVWCGFRTTQWVRKVRRRFWHASRACNRWLGIWMRGVWVKTGTRVLHGVGSHFIKSVIFSYVAVPVVTFSILRYFTSVANLNYQRSLYA
jgi:hypothetical protein